MYKAGLILEGGGMKGIYTAGVLDYFLEKEVEFESIYGVSMGSCVMCSFVSKQHGRGFRTVADNLGDKNYCGFYSLLTTGDIFNADMCYNRIPNELDPYDYDTAHAYKGNAYAVITDVETGQPVYYEMKDYRKDIAAIQASSSMPLVSRMVEIDGRKYLDGGISDCIPIMKSLKDGNRKNIVIMTKEEGYRREPFSMLGLSKVRYHKFPHLIHDLAIRHTRYNRTLDFLEKEQARGNVFVIRPKTPSKVGRLEKSRERLEELYQQGYEDAKACFDEMIAYLEK
ncbi:MAG: patatin family protein [Lachnospiraceae bacterium]|nr:patatin family protein [Lachnospiraceae bacterium]